jgi:DNA-directed RNA polymerase specialized sigma24 family protein
MLALATNISTGATPGYAIASDFCRIFRQDMNSLYMLSLVLTADRDKAEQCFTSGLEDSVKANRVFRDWARSWARRMIIQNAIRMIRPMPERAGMQTLVPAGLSRKAVKSENVSIAAVLALPAFERFVFAMSVLERYSDQDCSILLGCSRQDVALARTQAAEHLASLAESSVPGAQSATGVFSQECWLAQSA